MAPPSLTVSTRRDFSFNQTDYVKPHLSKTRNQFFVGILLPSWFTYRHLLVKCGTARNKTTIKFPLTEIKTELFFTSSIHLSLFGQHSFR